MFFSEKKTEKFIAGVLILLSIAAALIKIFIGFDIDEGYAISMPYRLLQGDHLFRDMWEVHQTSAFLPAAVLVLLDKITGVTECTVLVFRVLATLVHALISCMVWVFLKKKCSDLWSMVLALLYFNMLPKWLISFDFSMQQVWGLTLVILLLAKETENGKKRYAFLMGMVLAATVLAYPGMVLSYPALLLGIWILHIDEEIKTRLNKMALVTLGCGVMAVLFFIYVLSFMGVTEFLESIPMVFMDGTHQFTLHTKITAYAAQWMNVVKQLLILAIPSFIITIVIYIRQKRKQATHVKISKDKITAVFLLSFVTVTSLLVIFANVVGIRIGPFHFQVRYLLFFVLMFVWGIITLKNSECRFLFWGPMFQMMVAFAAILIFSNVGPDSSSSYLSIGLIAGFILLDRITIKMGTGEIIKSIKVNWNRMAWYVLCLFVLSLIFCKGYYVRITEYGPSNIFEQRRCVDVGPLKGIYVSEDDYERIISDYESIQNAASAEESLLYLGTEGISNLYAKGKFVSPSTISTPAFNEQWVTYFEMHPDYEPDVVVLAKNTIDDREKFFAQNPLGIWIAGRYDVMNMQETDSLCIIKKK